MAHFYSSAGGVCVCVCLDLQGEQLYLDLRRMTDAVSV